MILFMVGIFISSFVFEKPFLKFNSFEESVNYSYPEHKIIETVEGKNSGFVIYWDYNDIYIADISKKDGKWLVSNPNIKITYDVVRLSDYSIDLKEADDGSVLLLIYSTVDRNKNFVITDSLNSNITRIRLNNKAIGYYVMLEEMPEGYYLEIEGQKVTPVKNSFPF